MEDNEIGHSCAARMLYFFPPFRFCVLLLEFAWKLGRCEFRPLSPSINMKYCKWGRRICNVSIVVNQINRKIWSGRKGGMGEREIEEIPRVTTPFMHDASTTEILFFHFFYSNQKRRRRREMGKDPGDPKGKKKGIFPIFVLFFPPPPKTDFWFIFFLGKERGGKKKKRNKNGKLFFFFLNFST